METTGQYSRKYKLDAVKKVQEQGLSIAAVALDLEIDQTELRAWIKELSDSPQQAKTGRGWIGSEQAVIERLHLELAKFGLMQQKKPAGYSRRDSLKA
jgi:transposase-like protein